MSAPLAIKATAAEAAMVWESTLISQVRREMAHRHQDSWHMHNNNVANANGLLNTQIGLAYPNPFYYMVNSPSLAQCPGNPNPTCTARTWTALTYLNYEITPMDNICWPRLE